MTGPRPSLPPASRAPARSAPGTAGLAGRSLIRLGRRTWVLLAVTSIVGLAAFLWPLAAHPHGSENFAHASDAPWLFVLILPLLLAILLAELADGHLDAKAIAVLGVLTACGAALRLPSAGVTGFTPLFFLLIPAARVFGRGFGFVLGALTMFVSALLTGGVGPWLPFEMLGAAWVGFGAGCLPPAKGRLELWWLALYGGISGLAYGLLLDLWFWPFASQGEAATQFAPGGGVVENLQRFWAYHLATGLGFDIPRAIGNVVLILVAGRPVLVALRRAARRASFGAVATFDPAAAPDVDPVAARA